VVGKLLDRDLNWCGDALGVFKLLLGYLVWPFELFQNGMGCRWIFMAFEAKDREEQAALGLQGKQGRVFAQAWTPSDVSIRLGYHPPPLACLDARFERGLMH